MLDRRVVKIGAGPAGVLAALSLVERIDRDWPGWRLTTSNGDLRARHVVVATGHQHKPLIPSWLLSRPALIGYLGKRSRVLAKGISQQHRSTTCPS